MSDRPLSPRMVAILRVLAENDRPMTGNQIGTAVGAAQVEGGGSGTGRGSGHRMFGSAQQIIPALIGLRRRGLIAATSRPDGRSGTADVITPEGLAVLNENGTGNS